MLKLLKFFLCVFSLLPSVQSYGFFQIVEVFPNTIDDKNLEYITLQNISQEAQSLSGYILSDKVKDYVISTDEVLDVWEKQKFLRWETKLILNNSNEEIFFTSSDGAEIDTVSYKDTIKWEVIRFELKADTSWIEEILISDEVFISWEVIISDEVLLEILDDEINESSEYWDNVSELRAPEVLVWFQRPSYISIWDSKKNIYRCDDSRDECKINFDLRDSFTNNLPEKDYICRIDFGFWEITGQEEKCNPNTVIFPKWEFEVVFKIYHEDDEIVFSQRNILIENISHKVLSQEKNEEISILSSSGSFSNISIQQHVDTPKIIFHLQRPSYITLSDKKDIFYCDSSQSECKVNFDLRDSFGEDFLERDYFCEIDFGVVWTVFWEENKCNPNTIIFPVWSHEITFRIRHKDFPENTSEKTIYVEHIFTTQNITNTPSQSSWIKKTVNYTPRIQVGTSSFIVQSWLTGEWYEYFCKKEICKINLKYEPKYKQEKCFWDFAWWIYSDPKTQHKCNPSYVEIPFWMHKLSLKVYDSNYEDNFIIFPFTVYPKSESKTWEWEFLEQVDISGDIFSSQEDIKLWIELQGRISKNKILSWSILTCTWVEKCSVNLAWKVEWNNADVEYIWKIDGEIFSQKLNPAGIWIEWEWMHEIIFLVGDTQEKFYVNIVAWFVPLWKNWTKAEEDIQENIIKSKIKFTQNFLPLKYDGLRISWLAPAWSRLEIYHQGEKIFGWVADEKWKYRLVSKAFKAWEYVFDTKIILDSWEEIFIEKSWEYILTQEKRANWFTIKKVSNKKKNSTSSSSSKVPPKLVVKESKIFIPEEIETLSLREKIFFIAWLLFLALCMLLHMISKTSKLVFKDVFSIYAEQYCVKHKITLILP